MGGPAGSGGSDRSDEKKVDTYSNQLKSIENSQKSIKNHIWFKGVIYSVSWIS